MAVQLAKKTFRGLMVAAFALMLLLLFPVLKLYHVVVKPGNGGGKEWKDRAAGDDAAFLPLDEIQFIRPVRADIPPH